jgi:hypothetical protein
MKNCFQNRFSASAIVILIGAVFWINPFKVTNPADPRFDPDKFSFSDYAISETEWILKKMFPVGIRKAEVDRILIETGAATQYDLTASQGMSPFEFVEYTENDNFWRQLGVYSMSIKRQSGHLSYKFLFDKDGQLLNIDIDGAGYIYADQMTHKDVWNKSLKKNDSHKERSRRYQNFIDQYPVNTTPQQEEVFRKAREREQMPE